MFPEWGLPNVLGGVSPETAQRLSVVFTCLNVLGETVGSLPCDVKKATEKGRVPVYNQVYRLLHDRPNPNMTAFTFWSMAEKVKKAWGNFFAEIIRNGRMDPVALEPLPSNEVQIKVGPDGDVFYLYKGRTIRSTDMLHFKNYPIDGICGVSTIRQNALTIGLGLKLKEYNSKIVGDRPHGFLTSETRPKDFNAKANITGLWNNRNDTTEPAKTVQTDKIIAGTVNGIPLLYGGVKYEQLTLPADDVAFIEATNLTNKDIYGIFRVPPTFGQDWENTPYNGAEQQDIVFAKYTLASLREMEQECNEKLFPESNKTAVEPLYVQFNLKGLLRGDIKTRQEFYSAMFNIGVLNANEIRELEDKTAYEGGEDYYLQGALIPVKKITEFIDSKIKAANNKGQSKKAIEGEVKSLLRTEMKKKLNGHFSDVEELLR